MKDVLYFLSFFFSCCFQEHYCSFLEILIHVFLCSSPLKLWYQITLCLKTPRIYRVNDLCKKNCYPSQTVKGKTLNLLVMCLVHLRAPSIYSYRKEPKPPSSSYCPLKIWTFNKNTYNFFFTIPHIDMYPLEIEGSTLADQNYIRV